MLAAVARGEADFGLNFIGAQEGELEFKPLGKSLVSLARRSSRKEIRGETSSLKKSSTTHRSEIAALKRRVLERKRLGLSVAQCGLLIGASGQWVYNWEEGKAVRVPGTCRPSSRSETWVAGRQTRSFEARKAA